MCLFQKEVDISGSMLDEEETISSEEDDEFLRPGVVIEDDSFFNAQSYSQVSKEHSKGESPLPQIEVGNSDLLCNSRFLFASLSGSLSYFMFSFLEPILAHRLS